MASYTSSLANATGAGEDLAPGQTAEVVAIDRNDWLAVLHRLEQAEATRHSEGLRLLRIIQRQDAEKNELIQRLRNAGVA